MVSVTDFQPRGTQHLLGIWGTWGTLVSEFECRKPHLLTYWPDTLASARGEGDNVTKQPAEVSGMSPCINGGG